MTGQSLSCLVGLAIAMIAPAAVAAPLSVPAFPGAEGYGRLAAGGRGGVVFHVTSLADSGSGTLRAAVEAKGRRTVVFDVAGTIALTSPLKVSHPNITIAGQTAPGDGVTLRDQPLIIASDDVVVRYIRARLGDVSKTQEDAISIIRGRRIILDHVSASWSVDETLSAGSRYDPPQDGVYDLTVQWSLIAESLNHSAHLKGRHGYGSLIRGGYGARFSWHHNLWANHQARMPRPGNYNAAGIDPTGPLFEFRNNVFYNWGGDRAGYNADSESLAAYDFIGNWYQAGPDSEGDLAFCEQNPLARAWFSGNVMNGVAPDDPWALVGCAPPPDYRATGPLADSGIADETAARAYTRVLAGAGASLSRDSVDWRIVAGVRDGTGRLIDSQTEVGGWPDLRGGLAWIDSDGDGMPDDWERTHGFNPRDGSDGATDRDGDGFSNLEDWLNSRLN
ncbi:MAG: pectate lyase [Caulobacter sp.]|nr:pectate lyase [Caulobacter sp.]